MAPDPGASQLTLYRKTVRGVCVAAIAGVVLTIGIYFARQSGADPHSYGNDFSVYYFASSELLAGRNPYQQSLSPWTPYLYPPLLAELMLPLGLLPLPVAAYVWFLFGVAATLVLTRMSASLAGATNLVEAEAGASSRRDWSSSGNEKHAWLIAGLAALICLRFILDNFKLGQVNTIVAALAVAHVYLYAGGRRRLSALVLALAVAIKLTPALLIVYHLARRRWRFALGSAALMIAVNGISFLPFGLRAPEVFAQFFDRTVRNQQGFDLAYTGNQSLRGLAGRLSGEGEMGVTPPAGGPAQSDLARRPLNSLALVLALFVLSGAIFAAMRARTEAAAAAPFFCCLVLLSPLSWKVHFVIMVLPTAFLLARAYRAPASLQKKILIGLLLAVFALFDLTSRNISGLTFAEWADAHSLVLSGGLIVYGAAVWQATRHFVTLNSAGHLEIPRR